MDTHHAWHCTDWKESGGTDIGILLGNMGDGIFWRYIPRSSAPKFTIDLARTKCHGRYQVCYAKCKYDHVRQLWFSRQFVLEHAYLRQQVGLNVFNGLVVMVTVHVHGADGGVLMAVLVVLVMVEELLLLLLQPLLLLLLLRLLSPERFPASITEAVGLLRHRRRLWLSCARLPRSYLAHVPAVANRSKSHTFVLMVSLDTVSPPHAQHIILGCSYPSMLLIEMGLRVAYRHRYALLGVCIQCYTSNIPNRRLHDALICENLWTQMSIFLCITTETMVDIL